MPDGLIEGIIFIKAGVIATIEKLVGKAGFPLISTMQVGTFSFVLPKGIKKDSKM